MNDLIARLESWLRDRRPGYLGRLAPGATDEQILAVERELGRQLPDGLAALYRWRNGQTRSCYEALHDNRVFLSLEAAAEARRALTGLRDGGAFSGENWWRRGWVPFLANGAGDHLCVDVDGAFAGEPGQLVEFWHDDESRAILFPDFGSYLEALVRSLEETDWEDDEKYWEIDPEIAAEVSPGYPKRFTAR